MRIGSGALSNIGLDFTFKYYRKLALDRVEIEKSIADRLPLAVDGEDFLGVELGILNTC